MRTENKPIHGHFQIVHDFTRVEETPRYFHELQQVMGTRPRPWLLWRRSTECRRLTKKTVSWPYTRAEENERLGRSVGRLIEGGGKSAANGVCGPKQTRKPRWCVDCLVATCCAGAGSGMAHYSGQGCEEEPSCAVGECGCDTRLHGDDG
jgi:hypothetical protein